MIPFLFVCARVVHGVAVAAVLLAVLAAVGCAVLPRSIRPTRARLAVPVFLSVGALAVGWSCWLVGTWVGTWAILPIVACLALFTLRQWRELVVHVRRFTRAIGRLACHAPWLAGLVVLVPVALFPALALPLHDSDGIRYHVALPKLFDLVGTVHYYPYDVTGAFPQTTEMLYLIALQCGRPEAAKLVHAAFFLAGLSVMALVVHRDRRSRVAALVAPLLFAAAPVALAPASAAFTDHFAAFHLACAVLLLVARGPAVLIGLTLAAALATKITVGPAVAAVALAAIAIGGRKGSVRRLVAVALPVLIAWAPFALRNVRNTGDPIYPVGFGLFGKAVPGVDEDRRQWASNFHEDVPGFLGILWGVSEGEGDRDEVVGWHHLLGLLCLAVGVTDRRTRLLALPLLASATIGFFFKPPTRYLLPALWALAAIEGRALALVRRRWLVAAALLLAAPAAYQAWRVIEPSSLGFRHLLGRTSRSEFLASKIPGFRAAELVNAQPAGGAVMALDFPGPFYFDRPWIVEGVLNRPPLAEWIACSSTAAEVLRDLRQHGVRYLVVTPGYGGGSARPLEPLARSADAVARVRVLRSSLRLIASIDGVDVFEIPLEGGQNHQ
jgi:hypothetical protein